MNRFASRRLVNLGMLLLASAATLFLWRASGRLLHPPTHLTGWVLFGLVATLSVYTLKKRVPVLPVGGSSLWLQFHVYAGALSGVVFLVHTGARVPRGGLEEALAGLFGLVFVTGVAGLCLTRLLSRRLAAVGAEAIFEQIPALREQLLAAADEIVVQAATEAGSTAVPDFYARHLRDFLATPGSPGVLFAEAKGARHRLVAAIHAHLPYLTPAERSHLERLAALVRQKSDLDYQRAAQWALKRWLYVHVPATYSLLLVALVHGGVAHGFGGASG